MPIASDSDTIRPPSAALTALRSICVAIRSSAQQQIDLRVVVIDSACPEMDEGRKRKHCQQHRRHHRV